MLLACDSKKNNNNNNRNSQLSALLNKSYYVLIQYTFKPVLEGHTQGICSAYGVRLQEGIHPTEVPVQVSCYDNENLRTFALIVFAHPHCARKFMSQCRHVIHRARSLKPGFHMIVRIVSIVPVVSKIF